MKKTVHLTIILLLAGLCSNAQHLVNQGVIRITTGSTVVINGNFRNESSGSLNNSGNIRITGNWINNATSGNLLQGTSGTVNFSGTTTQSVGGSARTWFSNVNLLNNILLDNLVSVSGILTFVNKKISLGNHNLLMLAGSTLSGHGSSAYMIATGNGQLFRQVGASNTEFPVGTSTSYVPVVLNNAGTIDNFGVSVFADVRTNGLLGSTIPEISHCVNMTWSITESVAGGSDLTITPYWSASIEGVNFDRSQSGIGHYTSGAWSAQEVQSAAGANPYSLTRSGITSLSAFAVGDLNTPMAEESIPAVISVENITLAMGESHCYEATQTITVAGDGTTFLVENGAEAFFVAGQNIVFLPGTTVEEGGYLHARITTDDNYCSNSKSLIAASSTDEKPLIVAIGNDEINELFRVYPNPSTGIFFIEISETTHSTVRIELFNSLGIRVINEKLESSARHFLDLSVQPRGLYIIRLHAGNDMQTGKIILQ